MGPLQSKDVDTGRDLDRSQGRSLTQSDYRLGIQILLSAAAIYALCWPFVAPDLDMYLIPWLGHIRAEGPVGAFAEPFGNYTPPYLYLLSATSLLGLSPVTTIKLLSVLGTVALALSVRRLLQEADRPEQASLILFLLPTLIANGPLLGQCDTLWTAACILALSNAIRRNFIAMLVWSGVGIAFKAQAIFLAPFVIAVLISEKVPLRIWPIPILIYVALMLPAFAVGWPAHDLATIYVNQAAYFNTISSAPNPWIFAAAAFPREPLSFFWAGYLAAGLATVAYIVFVARSHLDTYAMFRAALLSSMMLPWLLPKMHERFFFLADIIAFALAGYAAIGKAALSFLESKEHRYWRCFPMRRARRPLPWQVLY